jgi:hypothetical protein
MDLSKNEIELLQSLLRYLQSFKVVDAMWIATPERRIAYSLKQKGFVNINKCSFNYNLDEIELQKNLGDDQKKILTLLALGI